MAHVAWAPQGFGTHSLMSMHDPDGPTYDPELHGRNTTDINRSDLWNHFNEVGRSSLDTIRRGNFERMRIQSASNHKDGMVPAV